MSSDSAEIRLLGPVELRVGGQVVDIGPTKARLAFALLAHEAGRAVPVHRLIEVLWGDSPPRTAKNALHGHVFRVRAALASVPEAGLSLETAPGGYLLRATPTVVDAHLFRALVTRAGSAAEDETAVGLLRRALALWRGRVAMDAEVDGEPVAFGQGLTELRLAATEACIDAELRLGRHHAVLAELTELLAENPLRERPIGQLMLALHRCGRSPEALEVYQSARRRYIDELGIEPGETLRQLHTAVLSGDPALDPPVAPEPAGPRLLPRQLPSDVGDFTGRQSEVDIMLDALRPSGRSRAVPVVAVCGSGGIGKTSLALHAAHRLAEHYPDGQLWVSLGGPGDHETDPHEVLATFLNALGTPPPAAPEQRETLYRSLLAGRRMLIVLDNAAGEEQVRPLIPGGPGNGVLITSRARLAGLSGARHVELDLLGAATATEFLGLLAGRSRTTAEPEATAEIARLCGGLPLALRIAGSRLAARPHWRIQRLADQLADEHRRLDVLRHGDLEVRASVQVSYAALSEPARKLLLRLSLLDAPDFASWVAAALLDGPQDEADELIEQLADARLVDVAGMDAAGQLRYRLHDLIRLHSRERATESLGAEQQSAALGRAFGAWLGLVDETLPDHTVRYFRCCPSGAPRWPASTAVVRRAPRAWLDSERAALVSAVRQAAGRGLTALSWDLAASLADFFETGAHAADWRSTHEAALAACRAADDWLGQAVMLRCLGELHTDQDRNDLAVDCFERARAIFTELGERHATAVCDGGLGHLHRLLGNYAEALARYTASATVAAELGSPRTEAYARHGCGVVHMESGRFDEARQCYQRARELAAVAGNDRGEAQSLRGLALLHLRRDELDLAESTIRASLAISLGLADPPNEANARQILADVKIHQGELSEVRPMLDRCMTVYEQFGEPFGQALTLRTLGDLHRAAGHPAHGITALERSVRIWDSLGLSLWHARALESLGLAYRDAGFPDAANQSWYEALRLLAAVDSAEATNTADRLRHNMSETVE